MPDCPHCSKNIENLTGFISQADLEERIKKLRDGKDLEIKAHADQLTELRTQNNGYAAMKTELDGLKAADVTRTQQTARVALFTAEAAKVDPALLPYFEQLYDISQMGAADADKATFEAWFASDAARKHVLLEDKFGKGAAGVTDPVAAAAAAAAALVPGAGSGINHLPTVTAAVQAPGPAKGLTPADVRKYFQTTEFQQMTPEAKRAKAAELETLVHSQEAAARVGV